MIPLIHPTAVRPTTLVTPTFPQQPADSTAEKVIGLKLETMFHPLEAERPGSRGTPSNLETVDEKDCPEPINVRRERSLSRGTPSSLPTIVEPPESPFLFDPIKRAYIPNPAYRGSPLSYGRVFALQRSQNPTPVAARLSPISKVAGQV